MENELVEYHLDDLGNCAPSVFHSPPTVNLPRRTFLAGGLVAAVTLNLRSLAADRGGNGSAPKPIRPEPDRGARQDLDTVLAYIRAGHGELEKLKAMTAANRRLVFAAWDWGGGDWETALGGASHIGHRDCARFLLSQGARIDAFCAAMLGQREVLRALVEANPMVAKSSGPHGYRLLYHVAISGDVEMAEFLRPALPSDAKDYNQALSAAVRDGHRPMTRWLCEHGTVDLNQTDALGRTPLEIAKMKGFTDVADELERRGAAATNKNG